MARGVLVRSFALACLPALLLSCGTPPANVGDNTSGPGQPLRVIATFLPITLLTRAVAGECAEVATLVPPSAAQDFSAPGLDGLPPPMLPE